MNPWTRRDLLLGLLATGGVACVPKRPQVAAAPVAPEPVAPLAPVVARPKGDRVRFGWRWVPGDPFVYESKVARTISDRTWLRAEAWSYTPRTLDPSGVLDIHGELVGFGATIIDLSTPFLDLQIKPAREVARSEAVAEVDLALRLNGQLIALSVDAFADALPHRLLAAHFPTDPVVPGTSWSDLSLAVAFARWLPPEVPLQAEGRTTYRSLDDSPRGYQATLEHVSTIRTTDGGPVISLQSTIQWDTEPGCIARRTLEAHITPDATAGGQPVGTLRAEIVRQKRGDLVHPT